MSFNYTKKTQFEEIFAPSDGMLDDEAAHYWMRPIKGTAFNFASCSFSESADVLFQNSEGKWTLASPEEQSIRLLAPSDADSCICSFKGVVYYPFKTNKNAESHCMHKFTEDAVKIGAPRKLVTLSYSGRVDIFQCYIKDIPEYEDTTPEERSDKPKAEAPAAPAKPATIEVEAPPQIPKNIGSVFSNIKKDDKPSFLDKKPEPKQVPKESTSIWNKGKGDSLSPNAPDFDALRLGHKKQVSFSGKTKPSAHDDPDRPHPDTKVKSILKTSGNTSPIGEHSRHEAKKEEEPEEKFEKIVKSIEQQEQEFLETIKDSF